MKIVCPHCQQHYEIDDSYAGNWTICESCGKNFAIPDAATISSSIPEAELIQEAASESNQDANSEHCPFCGGELAPGVKKCRHCGEWLVSEGYLKSCPFCGGELAPGVKKCRHCGEWLISEAKTQLSSDDPPKSRLTYILLALFVGLFGIHDFYAGYTNRGVIAFLLTLTWFGAIISAFMALYDMATVTHDAAGVRFKE